MVTEEVVLTKKQKQEIAKRKEENKAIEKKNAAFRALPKDQQRMGLAKEVLALVKTSKFKMRRSAWYLESRGVATTGELKDWQDILPKIKTCTVCMLGISAVASIRLRDKAVLGEVGTLDHGHARLDQWDCFSILKDLFSENELEDMEFFFEQESYRLSAKKAVEVLWGYILKNKGKYDIDEIRKAYAKAVERAKKLRS